METFVSYTCMGALPLLESALASAIRLKELYLETCAKIAVRPRIRQFDRNISEIDAYLAHARKGPPEKQIRFPERLIAACDVFSVLIESSN